MPPPRRLRGGAALAAARRQRSDLRAQVRRTAKLLRQYPDAVAAEVAPVLRAIVEEVRSRAVAGINRVSGVLQAEVQSRFSRSNLIARVGIIGKASRNRAFYARFVELGTPSTVYKRGARKGSPRRPVRARPFLQPAWRGIRNRVTGLIRDAVARAFRRGIDS